MNEIEPVEGMFLFDTPKHVHTALSAGVSLDSCALVHDMEFVALSSDLNLVSGDHTHDRKECTGGLPTLGTAACVVVGNVAPKSYFDRAVLAMATKFSTAEVWVPFGNAVVEERVERDCHVEDFESDCSQFMRWRLNVKVS